MHVAALRRCRYARRPSAPGKQEASSASGLWARVDRCACSLAAGGSLAESRMWKASRASLLFSDTRDGWRPRSMPRSLRKAAERLLGINEMTLRLNICEGKKQ